LHNKFCRKHIVNGLNEMVIFPYNKEFSWSWLVSFPMKTSQNLKSQEFIIRNLFYQSHIRVRWRYVHFGCNSTKFIHSFKLLNRFYVGWFYVVACMNFTIIRHTWQRECLIVIVITQTCGFQYHLSKDRPNCWYEMMAFLFQYQLLKSANK